MNEDIIGIIMVVTALLILGLALYIFIKNIKILEESLPEAIGDYKEDIGERTVKRLKKEGLKNE